MKYFHQSAQNGNVARAWLTARNKLRDSGVKPADYGAFILGGAANINAYKLHYNLTRLNVSYD